MITSNVIVKGGDDRKKKWNFAQRTLAAKVIVDHRAADFLIIDVVKIDGRSNQNKIIVGETLSNLG